MMAERFDYIVIGSGSAGSVLAARLSEDPDCRVLVLEAGGSDDKFFYRRPGGLALVYQVPQLKKAADWGYRTVPLSGMDNRRMPYTRGRIVGGCSTVNGMLYVRGHRDNYDRWAGELGCTGWSWDELLPLFKRSEGHEDGASATHGGEGPLRVTHQQGCSIVSDAWVEAAAAVTGAPKVDDFNSGDNEGIGFYQQTCYQRRRSSAAVAFLHPALSQRSNLTLRTQALVHRLLIENGRCIGVRYEHQGHLVDVHADAEVVLSAGAIGSPQILMLSGIGPADHLKAKGVEVVHDLPGVGGNLHDHLYVPVRFNCTSDTGHTSTSPHFLWGMFKDFAFNQGWFGKTFLEGGGFVRTHPGADRANMQYLTIPWAYPEPNDDDEESLFATITGIGAKGPIATNPSYTVMPILLYPKSRGTVRLDSSDPRTAPLIDPAFLVEPEDMEILLHGVKQTREIAAHPAMRPYVLSEAFPGPLCSSDDDIRAHIRLAGKTVYHPVGSCKMGIDDAAVVDPTLRVRGIEGLRIADASIMPEIPGGNTNAPSICVGEKASDLLRHG